MERLNSRSGKKGHLTVRNPNCQIILQTGEREEYRDTHKIQ